MPCEPEEVSSVPLQQFLVPGVQSVRRGGVTQKGSLLHVKSVSLYVSVKLRAIT